MISFIKKTAVTFLVLIFLSSILFSKSAFCITIKKEEKLSHEFMKMVKGRYEFIKDPYIHDYVNKVGNRIVSVLPSQPFVYKFYVIKEDSYNAFAGPAGNIFINSGFFQAMENEEELAGILGHEIAHVACRHISGNIDRSKKLQFASLIGLAAGILLGVGGAPELSQAVTAGTMAGGQSAMLAFSREDEMQADQMGMEYLVKTGYKGDGLLNALKKIRSKDWLGSEIPVYLSTHPATSERIVSISSWLEGYSFSQKNGLQQDSRDFRLAQIRLTAIHGEADVGLNVFQAAVKADPTDSMAQYGYGLVLSKTGNNKDAIAHLKTALERNPFNVPILEDLGRILYLSGDYKKALDILENIAESGLCSPEAYYYLGCSRMKIGQLQNALNTLETLLIKEPDYTDALYTLGEIYNTKGLEGESHFYLGKYHKNKRAFKIARFHLKKALETLDSPEKKEEIHSLLAALSKKPKKMESKGQKKLGFKGLGNK